MLHWYQGRVHMHFFVAINAFFSVVISFLVTNFCIPLLSDIAHKYGILDRPDGAIKQHKAPTPYLGGVALYIGFIVALGLVVPFYNTMATMLIGLTVLLFIGLIDDLIVIKPSQKFFGQILAALCFLKAGLHLKEVFFIHHFWTIPISFLWILTVVNAYNLVDVMDGLATTLAICATASFLVIAAGLGHVELVYILCAFLGPLCAFLRYNWPVASMYLGDTGSLFIGGFLATIPFLIEWSRFNQYGYLSPLIILAVPLLEVGTLVVIRTWHKIPFFHGSPHHFSIYLRKKGWQVASILLYCIALSFILFIAAFLLIFTRVDLRLILISGLIFLFFWYLILFFTSTKKSN